MSMSLAIGDGPPIGGDGVTKQKAVVEKYPDGFRRGDLARTMSCLSDDVVWALHGAKTLVGKDAFAAQADGGDGPNPELTLDRASRGGTASLRGGEGNTVAVVGHGCVAGRRSGRLRLFRGVHVYGRTGEPAGHVPHLAR